MDPLFWILSGVVVGCLIGIIILWRLESTAEKHLAAQRLAGGESAASVPLVDPVAELERMDTRPVPAIARPTPADRRSAGQHTPPAERGEALQSSIQVGKLPTTPPQRAASALPLEDLPTSKLPTPVEELPTAELPTPAVEELPTAKLPGVAPPQQPAPAAQPLNEEALQDIASATPDRARLRLAELARERSYLEHTLEANQSRLAELQGSQALPDSEEALAMSGLLGEIARQQQRLLEMKAWEQGYRQVMAAWSEQVSEQGQQTGHNAPKAFGARRLARARAERAQAEPSAAEPSSPPG